MHKACFDSFTGCPGIAPTSGSGPFPLGTLKIQWKKCVRCVNGWCSTTEWSTTTSLYCIAYVYYSVFHLCFCFTMPPSGSNTRLIACDFTFSFCFPSYSLSSSLTPLPLLPFPQCCDDNCPPCEQTCNKTLSCRKHKCAAPCHLGKATTSSVPFLHWHE